MRLCVLFSMFIMIVRSIYLRHACNSESRTSQLHSQTFENKSSLPENPPLLLADLLCCGSGLLAAGVGGAALLQPPKSSSCATVGVGCEALPKPLLKAFDCVFVGAVEPPQAEKSFDMGIEGALAGAAG